MVCQQAVAIPETNRRNFPGSGSAFGSSIAITFSPSQMVDHRTRTDCRTRAGQSSRARRPRVKFAPVENCCISEIAGRSRSAARIGALGLQADSGTSDRRWG